MFRQVELPEKKGINTYLNFPLCTLVSGAGFNKAGELDDDRTTSYEISLTCTFTKP